MFFDTKRSDEDYRLLLAEEAQAQRRAFLHRFDWAARRDRPLPRPRAGFFGKKAAPTAYETALEELSGIRERIASYREGKGYRAGLGWWSVPWEQLESFLRYDLTFATDAGPWRYEYQVNAAEKDGTWLIWLHEEGHFSDFSGSHSHTFHIESPYTDAEREDMVRNYNRDLNRCALVDITYDLNRPVHSLLSGTDYATKADYYLSSEYLATRMYLSESYDRKLYTEKETYGVTAVSRSRHYHCAYALAQAHVRPDGVLDRMTLMPFTVLRTDGDVPEDIEKRHSGRDAAVLCAGYLADHPAVRAVPMRLFGKDLTEGAASFEEAVRQAEIFTCLADKLQ